MFAGLSHKIGTNKHGSKDMYASETLPGAEYSISKDKIWNTYGRNSESNQTFLHWIKLVISILYLEYLAGIFLEILEKGYLQKTGQLHCLFYTQFCKNYYIIFYLVE